MSARSMADWWNAQSASERERVLLKRNIKASVVHERAELEWSKLGWFIQGILNDSWWWTFVKETRPDVADGPVDPE